MKIMITLPSGLNPELADQLRCVFQAQVENELRLLRGEYCIGDRVQDFRGQVLRISEIFEGDPHEYELRSSDGYRVWARATPDKFKPYRSWEEEPCDRS